jgi:hypothetical protein
MRHAALYGVPGVFRYSNRSTCRAAKSSTAPLMRLRPLQGTTRLGPPVHPALAFPTGDEPFDTPEGASPGPTPASPRSLEETAWIRRGKTLDHWAFRQLSWSSSPLRRMNSGESTSPRLASPGRFRPQGFSPSRRIAPRPSARPCFIPVTPMGFCSPGIFPHSQVRRLPPSDYPLGVSPRTHKQITACEAWRLAASGLSAHVQTFCRPQGFAPAVNPYRRVECYIQNPTADSLLSFEASPGYCPDPMATSRATRSLMRFSSCDHPRSTEQARLATDRRSGCAPATSPPDSGSHSRE